MFQPQHQEDIHHRDSLTCDLDSPQLSTPPSSQPLPQSASSSDTTSPTLSLFSSGHAARSGSNASSIASSPALRDSFENFTPSKRLLTDVKEEPHEREDADMTDALNNHAVHDLRLESAQVPLDQSMLTSPLPAPYNFNESDASELQLSANLSIKKRRSGDSPVSVVVNRLGTRFPSFSRKWKNKTGANPKLSIVTHSDTIRSRTNSASSQLISPALSAISKHESLLSSPSVSAGPDESSSELGPAPIAIERANAYADEDQGQATTPLLPPIMMELSSKNLPLQSPLQSPTVAETTSLQSSATPCGTPQLPSLLSPPLSTKPSLASIRQRSRAGTVVPSSEIPPLQMLGECYEDEWSARLGHANFTIYPEPYVPAVFDMETFKEFRESWDRARHSYAKHLTRTGEHYGTTSKTYLLTEEKWASVDAEWNKNNAAIIDALGPLVARSSGGEAELSDRSGCNTGLEQIPTKIIIPHINDPSGKFPDMGDEDIVGPMTVGPSRARTMQQIMEPAMQSRLSKKRSFLKFISDILGRGIATAPRT